MNDQRLIWNTDGTLAITSLTARLRALADVGVIDHPLAVGDLWGHDEATMDAHRWALAGESLSFEVRFRGSTYRLRLEPLCDATGSTIGVSGSAVLAGKNDPRLDAEVMTAAERAIGVGTWYEDLRTGDLAISDGLASLIGVDRSVTSLNVRSFDHPDEAVEIAAATADALREHNAYTHDHRIICDNGRARSVRERVRTLYDDRGVAIARLGTLADISDFKAREAELIELAHYDALTNLPNRSLLESRLGASLSRAERHCLHCAILFVDIDDFKRINDTYGHDIGDRVLCRVGEHLGRYVRASDTVARLGGDEFVVLLEDLMSDDAAVDAARKILRSFDEPFLIGERAVSVSASIGISTFPRCANNATELIARADHEMYDVKRNGGGGVKLALPIQEESSVFQAENTMCTIPSSAALRRFATRASA